MANQECTICSRTFSTGSSLRRHLRRYHPESQDAHVKTKIIRRKSVICPLCRDTLNCYQALVTHLTEAHHLVMKEEAHDFLSIDDFLKWKQEVEKVTESSFVKSRGTSALKCVRGTKDVYVCHRSGRPRSIDGGRVRQPKSQGSQKLDAFCPARMKVVTTEGRVFLNFLPTHVGHNTDPSHLRLSRSEKEMLAKKMADKRSLDDILQEIHNAPEPLGRLKLLAKQDLQNISRDVKLLTSVYSGSNIAELVDQLRESGNILFYKPKGVQLEPFSTEDFILCLANSQKYLPTEFVCLDSFESSSPHEFNLFSISAADDVAIPVAVLISNRKDDSTLNLFLKEVTMSSLDLNPCCVIHPRNTHFYAVWKTWFGKPKTHHIGTWHIEQEWREKLAKTVKNKVRKVEIYKTLKLLIEAQCRSDFDSLCDRIIQESLEDEIEFKNYFHEMSASGIDWAKFTMSRKLTEMASIFEKLHRTLNSAHLRYKSYETLGVLANSVVEFMNYRQDGETKRVLKDINARHRTAMKTECTITLEAENLWKVLFQGPREATCTVEKADFSCKCEVKCEECKFCLHAFRCSCMDFAKGNMCKHVHSICTSLFSDREVTVEEERFEELEPEPEGFEVIISEAVGSEEVEDGKLELQQDFTQILSMIRSVEDVNLVRNAFQLITPSLGLNKSALPQVVSTEIKEEMPR